MIFFYLIISFLVGSLGAFWVARFAGAMGLLDCPNERSSHCRPTPKGGGVGIALIFLLASILFEITPFFYLPIVLMSVLSFWGDRFELSPKFRLPVQLLLIGLFFLGEDALHITGVWPVFLSLFWIVFIVGTANFYNFMDGINGIAGITGILGFSFLAFYSTFIKDQAPLGCVSLCIAFACMGFLPFNIPKARVFMGDVGSILLGAAFGGMICLLSESMLDCVCMASFLFPFYADELSTMLLRIKDGENILLPHRRHLYQLLTNEKRIPHWRVSAGYGALQLLVSLSSLIAMQWNIFAVLLVLFFYYLIFLAFSSYIRADIKHCLPGGASSMT